MRRGLPHLTAALAVTVAPLLQGEVELVRGTTVTLRGPQGQRVDVDVGAIHAGAERLLLPGRQVSLLGIVAREDGALVAHGIGLDYAGRSLPPLPRVPSVSPPAARPSPSPVPSPAAPATPPPAAVPVEPPPGVVPPPQEPTLGPGPAPTPR